MNFLLWLIIPFILESIFLLKPPLVSATALQWSKANGIGSYSQEVRVAPSDPNIIYATIRSSGSGLFKSTDRGLNFGVVFEIMSDRDVNSIAISYSNPNKLCIGTYEQGVFCSTDGTSFSNTGWQNLGKQGLRTRFVATDPNNDNTLFAGTGENNLDGGIYKTTNFGANWTKVGASTYGSRNCLNIVVDKLNSNRIFATADDGLYRSLDGGQTWTRFLLYANLPALIIDLSNPSVLYAGTFGHGVSKSTNNGETWLSKNSGIEAAIVFRIAQDTDNKIYISTWNSPGGVLVSANNGDSWENISDQAWGSSRVWGLDIGGGRIYASVENFGVYVATTGSVPTYKTCQNNACTVVDGVGSDSCQINTDCIPPTHKTCVNYACAVVDGVGTDGCQIDDNCVPPGPKPVVVIPGFGGSWSYKGFIDKKETDYSDWELVPKFTDYYYQPILSALRSAGLTDSGSNPNLFVFAYDYRKSIKDTAPWLNDFLTEQVIPKNPGKKVDIAAHSMGGLVIRYCFEKVTGCAGKIDKIVTGGSPHQGSLEAYDFWEAGKIHEKDLLLRAGERLLLQLLGFPKINPKEIVQANLPGAADLLPTFPYIFGKDYDALLSGQNPTLPAISSPSQAFTNILTALSGMATDTARLYFVKPAPKREQLLGWWIDGRPWQTNFDIGDNTVLKFSSEVFEATNKYYSFSHADYFNNAGSIADTLATFGLTSSSTVANTQPTSFLTAYSTPNVSIEVLDKNNKRPGQRKDNNRSFFGQNLTRGNYRVEVTGQNDGNFEATVLYVDLKSEPNVQTFTGKIKKSESQKFNFVVN